MTSEQRKKLQQIELEQLNVFADLCEKHQLRYFLVGGTLLGAVRHQGFIPWDDDIDIAMPRADYNRFIEIAQRELPGQYVLETPALIPNDPYYLTRIRKSGTIYESNWIKAYNMPCTGIWIDIFPLDDQPAQDSFRQRLDGAIMEKLAMVIRNYAREGSPCESAGERIKMGIARLLPFSVYRNLRDRIARRHEGRNLPYWLTYAGMFGYKKETFAKSVFEPAARLPFEGREYAVPRDYDGWLRRMYGDYMQLPPPEKRLPHFAARLSFDTSGPDEDVSAN